jgi:hypothetical protein
VLPYFCGKQYDVHIKMGFSAFEVFGLDFLVEGLGAIRTLTTTSLKLSKVKKPRSSPKQSTKQEEKITPPKVTGKRRLGKSSSAKRFLNP